MYINIEGKGDLQMTRGWVRSLTQLMEYNHGENRERVLELIKDGSSWQEHQGPTKYEDRRNFFSFRVLALKVELHKGFF